MIKDSKRIIILFTIGLLFFSTFQYFQIKKLNDFALDSIHDDIGDFKKNISKFNETLLLSQIQNDSSNILKINDKASEIEFNTFSLRFYRLYLDPNITDKIDARFPSDIYKSFDLIFNDILKDNTIDSNESKTLDLIISYNTDFINKYNELNNRDNFSSDFDSSFIEAFTKESADLDLKEEYKPLLNLVEELDNKEILNDYSIKGRDTQQILDYASSIIADYGVLSKTSEFEDSSPHYMMNSDKDYYTYEFNDDGDEIYIYRQMYGEESKISEDEIDAIHDNIIKNLPVSGYVLEKRELFLEKDGKSVDYIKYDYSNNNNGEFNHFALNLSKAGRLDSLSISNLDPIDFSNESILSKDEVLKKLNLNTDYTDYKLVRSNREDSYYEFVFNLHNQKYILKVNAKNANIISFYNDSPY